MVGACVERCRNAWCGRLCYFPPGRSDRTTQCAQFTSRAAAADPCARKVKKDATDADTTFAMCERERAEKSPKAEAASGCNTLASRVVFARPGCCGVVQGVVSGFLTGRWLLPFSSSKKAGSHNLSIYPCVLTSVGSNMRESSGDSQLTLSPMYQAKTARCAAIGAPWAAQASNSAL